MDKTEPNSYDFKDLLFFYPIHIANFTSFLLSFMEGGFPRGIGVLMLLKKNGSMPISHIAEKLAKQKPNMTALVDMLTEKGWVKRSLSSSDRRVINLELTDEGLNYVDETISKIDCIIQDKMSVLTHDERSEIMRCLRFLIETGNKVMDAHNRNGKA